MGSVSDKLAVTDDFLDDRSRHILYLRFITHFIPEVVRSSLQDAFELSIKAPFPGFDSNASESQQKVKSTMIDSPNVAKLSFELQSFTSETKALFAETSHSLDLFNDYLQCPSEATAKPLGRWLYRGKSAHNELFTTYEIDESLNFIHTFLVKKIIQNSQDCDYITFNSVNKNVDYNLELYFQTNSISDEIAKIDLKEKITVFSKKIENSYEKEEEQQKKQNGKILAFKAKEISSSDQDLSNDQPFVNEKRKKAEWKIYAEDSSINKEIDALKSWKWKNQEILRELQDKIHFLEKQVMSLRIENREIMAQLGQVIVEQTAKESKGRRSEHFHQIFRSSSPEAKQPVVSTNNDKPDIEDDKLRYPNDSYVNGNGSPNGLPNPQATNEKGDSVNASVAYTATSGGQPVLGAEALVLESNQQAEKEEIKDKVQGGERDSTGEVLAMRKESERMEKTSGGEGISESGKVNGTSVLVPTSREESIEQTSTWQSHLHLSFSVQQDDSNGREFISLSNIPPTSVATTVYNNYKLLLLSLGRGLLSSEVVKLKDWASQNFSTNSQNATDVLLQLDQKGIINASDLSPLRDFFESIIRIDLVYIIDEFLLGDYSLLRQTSALKTRDANRAQNPQYGSTSRFTSFLNTLSSSPSYPPGSRTARRNVAASGPSQMSTNRNPATSRTPENSNGSQSSVAQQNHQPALSSFLGYPNTNNANLVSRSPNENQSTCTAHEQRNEKPIASGFTKTSVVVADGPVTNERRTTASNSSTRTNPPVKNNGSRITIGSNGSKLSKFSREGAERSIVSFAHAPNPSRNQDLDLESNWLCSHYKRLCYVKFECCDNFWPCHRCHNNQSTCGRKKLKSRDTQMVKCVYCNKEQQFGQFCCDCGAKFASYFCGLCQHLTGNDDHPYHCQKCGICRIHGDRSFHCDVCGVCLDVQLRGNHKCREGSAHDECCICLEDAFTGCQILPCSHKVHKECATQMIRSGIFPYFLPEIQVP
ncbi:RING finger and CHY zinc finger domain-containing 1 [Paramuricea clavata]|nr:RING finger and CHY zinc finger domain-containing 1 [Paramuricea clavata]